MIIHKYFFFLNGRIKFYTYNLRIIKNITYSKNSIKPKNRKATR